MRKIDIKLIAAMVIACGTTLAESAKAVTIFESLGHFSGAGVVSQVFEPAAAAYDSQGADYFYLRGTNTITEVDVVGYYASGNGPAQSENVFIYQDNNGTPGALVLEYQKLKGKDILGNFAITIPTTTLPAGNYWLSVTVNYPSAAGSATGGVWIWATDNSKHNRYPAVWQNPGNGYNSYCTTFVPEAPCSQNGNGPDLEFALKGP